ncbi:MAG TPA: chorismate pyruvate-lyase family protein [Acidimicrobiales bacterium]|nr:chorismate pyruvate-lyase family protein [Acidimicrobiales bacterium]
MSWTRFQRMLLGTDGTVTHILEAYADEPIDVVKLLQEIDTPKACDAHLLLSDGKVLRRRVLLRGRQSLRTLLYAEAVVAIERVDPAFLRGLLETDEPIGVLLAEHRTETFREILEVGREPAGSCGAHFAADASSELIFRTYRILAGQQPVILITEKFPADSFRGLPA